MEKRDDEEFLSGEAVLTSDLIKNKIDKLSIREDGKILKIGVGSGEVERYMANRVPSGEVLSIATYTPLIKICQQNTQDLPNLRIKKMSASNIEFENTFDLICSFMCPVFMSKPLELYWKLYTALKQGGQALLILPSGNGPVSGTLQQAIKRIDSSEIKKIKIPLDTELIYEVEEEFKRIPFSRIDIGMPVVDCLLPSLDVFRNLLSRFTYLFSDQLAPELIDALFDTQTKIFDEFCQKNHDGKYIFEFAPFVIHVIK